MGISALLLASCVEIPDYEEFNTAALSRRGEQLIENRCYSCHAPIGESDRSAPPMTMVKQHYYREGMDRTVFVNAIVNWIRQPEVSKSKMPGARRNWGMMPKQDISEEEARAIATYIYTTNFED
jgi:mono/diheme cytochrome c family protein